MKKTFLAVLFLAFFIFHFSIFNSVRAAGVVLSKDQTIDSDYIKYGDTVVLEGRVNGDAFLAGGLVTINGTVDGDLFVLGGKVTINGQVINNLRVLGGDVAVNGLVNRNVLVLGGNINISPAATIGGSLLSAGGNLDLSAGKIGRGFRFFGNRLYLNSAINHEAFVVADREFILGPRASISGNLKYTGNREAVLEPGATVAGNIAYEPTVRDEAYPRFFAARTVFSAYQRVKPLTDLAGFLAMALVGYVFLGLFPKIFERVAARLEKRPAAALGWGIVTALMIPVLAGLLAITIIGLPVSLLLVFFGAVLWLAAQYLMAFFVGRRIMLTKFGERRGWALVLGLFLLYLLNLIPLVGPLVKLVFILLALGALILSFHQPPRSARSLR